MDGGRQQQSHQRQGGYEQSSGHGDPTISGPVPGRQGLRDGRGRATPLRLGDVPHQIRSLVAIDVQGAGQIEQKLALARADDAVGRGDLDR